MNEDENQEVSVQLRFFDVFDHFHLFVEQFGGEDPGAPGDQNDCGDSDTRPQTDIPGFTHSPYKDEHSQRQGHDKSEAGEQHGASGVVLGPDVDIELAQVFLVLRHGGVEQFHLAFAFGTKLTAPECVLALQTKFDHNFRARHY